MNDTESEVIKDIVIRQLKGVEKYGTTVADNPISLKEWLQHAYEETLDQAIYLKRAIQELKQQEEWRLEKNDVPWYEKKYEMEKGPVETGTFFDARPDREEKQEEEERSRNSMQRALELKELKRRQEQEAANACRFIGLDIQNGGNE